MKHVTILLILLVLLLAGVWTALAEDGYNLTWWTVASGGGIASGGSYTVTNTIGQPDVGRMTGGSYTLAGGFWDGRNYTLFLPLIANHP